MRADLGQKPFAHLDQLGSLRCQSSEKAQLLSGKTAACFGPECEEAGDEFCIDPVCLGARATALSKCLHLSGWHLAGCNTFYLQSRPELPLLTARRFKTDDGVPIPRESHNDSMTCWSVGRSAAMPIGEAIKVQPVAADIYADNAAM